MNEALLHYIWQHRRYAPLHLQTQCGQKLQVLKTGQLNRNAGPDFENAHQTKRYRMGRPCRNPSKII